MTRTKKKATAGYLVKCLRVAYTDDSGRRRSVLLGEDPWFSWECVGGEWAYYLKGYRHWRRDVDVSILASRVIRMEDVQLEEA